MRAAYSSTGDSKTGAAGDQGERVRVAERHLAQRPGHAAEAVVPRLARYLAGVDFVEQQSDDVALERLPVGRMRVQSHGPDAERVCDGAEAERLQPVAVDDLEARVSDALAGQVGVYSGAARP